MKKLFSADHSESLSFEYSSESADAAIQDWTMMGARFFITNTRLAEISGFEETDYSEAKKAFLEAVKNGDHVFGINAGDHSLYWFRFSQNSDAEVDRWDGFRGLNFVVVNKEKFMEAFPRMAYARRLVFNRLKEMEEYFNAAINGNLIDVFYEGVMTVT